MLTPGGLSAQMPERDPLSLQVLSDLIRERLGLNYDHNRLVTLADKLDTLLVQGGFSSYLDYYYYLKYEQQSGEEWRRVQTALAVNETYFWREYDQIAAVVNVVVPRLQSEHPERPVRIWHAASASGEEPYSMAIALTEAGRFAAGPIQITATDFNMRAIQQARAGVYRPRSFRSIPPSLKDRYFVPHQGPQLRLVDAILEAHGSFLT